MKLMHSHGVGAQLMATFNNGISYEFLKGETLTPESVVRPDIYPLVSFLFLYRLLTDISIGAGKLSLIIN